MKFNRSFIKCQDKTPKLRRENNVHPPPQQLKIVDQSWAHNSFRAELVQTKEINLKPSQVMEMFIYDQSMSSLQLRGRALLVILAYKILGWRAICHSKS